MKNIPSILCALGAAFALAPLGYADDALPPLPQAATSFGATMNGGWLYVYGGNTGKAHEFNKESIKGDFFRLQMPGGVTWEKLPGGQPLLGPSLVSDGTQVIRIGGMNAHNDKGAKNDLFSTAEVMRFDPAASHWEPWIPLPEPRSSHDAVILDHTLFVGGGWKLTGDDGEEAHAEWCKTLYTLDLRAPEKGWQTLPQPFQRRAISAVAHEGRVWFIGGMNPDNKPSRAVDWFEPATGQWGKGPDLPDGAMGGFGVAACEQSGKLCVSPLSGKILVLSADGKTWEEAASLATPRFFHRLLPMATGRLIAVGGSNRQGQINTLETISLLP